MNAEIDGFVKWRRPLTYIILLGLFLTFRGYRSREGDQAYRIPILLHQQNQQLYSQDPFVAAFDIFNPHRGYLSLLDLISRPFGLSFALAFLFGCTFLLTCLSVDRLARSVWSENSSAVGVVAAALIVSAQAGNIGTNHLFEPLLLDRLIAFAFGWVAMTLAVQKPEKGAILAPIAVALAGLVHPSVGLQLAMLLAASWITWAIFAKVNSGLAIRAILLLVAAAIPGYLLNLNQSARLLEGLPTDDFRLLTVELQSPQHMLPHLWRMPQWIAAFCYPVLAALGLLLHLRKELPDQRLRLILTIGVGLLGLVVAWVGIELVGSLKLTLFQPFRMATIMRGLCLVALSGHIQSLFMRKTHEGRIRAVLLAVALFGDWSLVVVTLFESVMRARELFTVKLSRGLSVFTVKLSRRLGVFTVNNLRALNLLVSLFGWGILAAGLVFLMKHDTESGYIPLLLATVLSLVFGRWMVKRDWSFRPENAWKRVALAWLIPWLALAANAFPSDSITKRTQFRQTLVRLCRFGEVPLDDVERLALWTRTNTPQTARFISPPGPKTFRLWSMRSVAFNRSASPYNGESLGDWARRFRDHVGFKGTDGEFVRAYLRDRHALEARYDHFSDDELADLARRQGADHVLASVKGREERDDSPLERLCVSGKYAVYRVRGDLQVAKAGHMSNSF